MTKKELNIVLEVLEKIENPDFKVKESIALINRDIARADRYFQNRQEFNSYKIRKS